MTDPTQSGPAQLAKLPKDCAIVAYSQLGGTYQDSNLGRSTCRLAFQRLVGHLAWTQETPGLVQPDLAADEESVSAHLLWPLVDHAPASHLYCRAEPSLRRIAGSGPSNIRSLCDHRIHRLFVDHRINPVGLYLHRGQRVFDHHLPWTSFHISTARFRQQHFAVRPRCCGNRAGHCGFPGSSVSFNGFAARCLATHRD